MNRLLVSSSVLGDPRPELDKESRNHMKVWRLKDGEEVELFDGEGLLVSAAIRRKREVLSALVAFIRSHALCATSCFSRV